MPQSNDGKHYQPYLGLLLFLLAFLFCAMSILYGVYYYCNHRAGFQMIAMLIILVGSLAVFFLFYFIFRYLGNQHSFNEKTYRHSPIITTTISALLFSALAIAYFDRYLNDQLNTTITYTFNWQRYPIMPVAVVIVITAVILFLSASQPINKNKIVGCLVIFSYIFSAYQYALYAYNPNIFVTDAWHMTAVQTSIYNIAFDTPFTAASSSIYGHYALFFLPIVKLFGHREIVIAIGMTFFGVLSQALFLYSVHKLVRSDILRIIGALASVATVTAIRSAVYWQAQPMRVLPVSVIMAYAVWCYSHGNKLNLKRVIVGYGLCSLCILWVTDIGIAVTLAYSAYVCIWHWQYVRIFSRKMWRVYLTVVLGLVGAVIGMMLVTNIYNLLCDGPVILEACFYPFVDGSGFVTWLEFPFIWGNRSWIYVTLLFMFCLVLGLVGKRHAAFFEKPELMPYLALMAILGLCSATYYYNRAAYLNLDVTITSAVLCMMLLAQIGLRQAGQIRTNTNKGIAYIAVNSVFICLSAASVLSLTTLSCLVLQQWPVTLTSRQWRYNEDSLKSYAQIVRDEVPPNTYAFGQLTQEIYAQLGWDPQYHLKDVSDLFGDGITEVLAEVNAQDTLLVNISSSIDTLIQRESGLKPQKAIPENDPIFYYYTKDTPYPSECDFNASAKNDLLTLKTFATGIKRDSDTNAFRCDKKASLTLNALKQRGSELELRVSFPPDTSNSLAESEAFSVHILVNQTEVGAIICNPSDEKKEYSLTIDSTKMPTPNDDGTYFIELTADCQSDDPCYEIEYIGLQP